MRSIVYTQIEAPKLDYKASRTKQEGTKHASKGAVFERSQLEPVM